eukprot:3152161-Amphidinium_carterae.1
MCNSFCADCKLERQSRSCHADAPPKQHHQKNGCAYTSTRATYSLLRLRAALLKLGEGNDNTIV